MSQNIPDFRSGVIKSVDCLKEGYALIKDQYWLFLGITVLGLLIGGAVPIVLIGPMMCGIHLCLLQKMHGQSVKFETLFKGFDYFTQSLITSLIQFIPIFFMIITFYILFLVMFFGLAATQQRGADPGVAIGMFFVIFVGFLILMLVSALIQSFFTFSYPLIVDKKLSGMDAVKGSVNAVKANFGGVFGLVLINFALSIVGLFLCYVGALLVAPVTMASYIVAYRKVFPEGFSEPVVPQPWQA